MHRPLVAAFIVSMLCLTGAGSLHITTAAQMGTPGAAAWDVKQAHAECRDFITYGMAEEGVYGPWFQAMYDYYGWDDCHRTDNDLSSAEVLAAYEAEENNPQAVIADIGIAFGPAAAAQGLTLKYVPAGSEFVPETMREAGGGWIGSVVGAVGFTVNEEVVPNPPHAWADLLKPEYAGKIKGVDPTSGGTGYMSLLAANHAMGGTPDDLSKGLDFYRQLRESGNQYDGDCDIPNLERGECGVKIQYDFFGLSEGVEAMKNKGIKADFIVPSDGTIWAPSALLPNGYTDKPDLAKAILDWAMTDEAAIAWAKTYAHPLKQVYGGLELPAESTANWLPASDYADVATLESYPDVGAVADEWESTVLG